MGREHVAELIDHSVAGGVIRKVHPITRLPSQYSRPDGHPGSAKWQTGLGDHVELNASQARYCEIGEYTTSVKTAEIRRVGARYGSEEIGGSSLVDRRQSDALRARYNTRITHFYQSASAACLHDGSCS